MKIDFEEAKGKNLEEMKENARKGELFKKGDIKLVWMLESDLINLIINK